MTEDREILLDIINPNHYLWKLKMKKKLLLLSLCVALSLNAQDLKTSVGEVINTNPIIQERLKNYNATKEDITNAQSGYYPKLDLSLGAGIENTKKSGLAGDLPDTDDSFDVYQGSIAYTQNLFKGFETFHQVSQQENKTLSAAYSYIEKVNDTAFEMVNTYLQVMRNIELLETAKANVKINDEIFVKVKKLYDSGLTTLSEVNKIESSLALAKSNLVVQENTLLDVTYNMHRILGRHLKPQEMSKPVLNIVLPQSVEDAAQYAITHNPSLLVSDYNIKLAQATQKEKRSPFYPQLDIEVSQSLNRNFSSIEGDNNRFRAMAYLKYNIFNGFADSSALQKSRSQIHQEVESKNNLRRQVVEGLNLSWAAHKKLSEQLVHLEDYKKFSLKTLTLYSKEYDLGRRSLLDLLSAQNDFIGSKSQIINTEYSRLFAKYRILDAMGILVSTMMNGSESVYSNVGLAQNSVSVSDELPIRLDSDNDLITNDRDLCSNSLSSEMKNIYGCSFSDASVEQIERYEGFEFSNDELTSDGEEKIMTLISQLETYGLENIKFAILSNAEVNELSLKRAELIKETFINSGAKEEYISIVSNVDSSKMYLEDIDKNNRVDIVITKLKK